MTRWPTRFARVAGVSWMAVVPIAQAVYDPGREYVEAPAVAARYPDPAVSIATPAFVPGKTDFTSQGELEAYVGDLARRSHDLRVRVLGFSQEHRTIPLLVFARPSAAAGGDVQKNGKPTVLVIGQQHGNDLPRRTIAEKLAQGLFVPGDAVLFDQGDEIVLGVARQRRLAEMRVGRDKRLGPAQKVGEIAAPAARDQDLLADLVGVIQQQHPPSALAGAHGADQAGRTGTDHRDVKGLGHAGAVTSGTRRHSHGWSGR